MHKAHLTAIKVLENRDKYPDVVVALAEEIKTNREGHRQKIKDLWDIHFVLRSWIGHKNERILHAQETENPVSKLTATRFATARTTLEFGPVMMGTFHRGKNSFNTDYYMFNIMASKFLSSVELVEEMDVAMVYRYLACVNAERLDQSVAPVAYLRNIDRNVTCEILAWRLLQSSTKQ